MRSTKILRTQISPNTIWQMDQVALLPLAIAEVQARLNLVNTSNLAHPTNCEGWTIKELTEHLVGGSRMSTCLLTGGTREEAIATFNVHLSDNPGNDFAASAAEEIDAIGKADLAGIVPHPAMDMPIAQLLQFRISDYLIHGWDLARSLGTDETLNAILVKEVWDGIQPMAPMLAQTGVFGTGASGNVGEDAPLQNRLLDLLGRRP